MAVLTKIAAAGAIILGALLSAAIAYPQSAAPADLMMPPPQHPTSAPSSDLLGFQLGEANGTVPLSTLAHLRGTRVNHLLGHGLVVGLQNSGDSQQTEFTVQFLLNSLMHSGVNLPSTLNPTNMQVRNLAAVMVTADLPAFARTGSRIDLLVSSMGDARSLQGGTLLMTPLYGTDGQVYAVGQGPITIEGYFAGAGAGASSRKNFQTVGQIPNGATVEHTVANDFAKMRELEIEIDDPNPTVAVRAADAIAKRYADARVILRDPGTINVGLPPWMTPVNFAASLDQIRIQPAESDRVVVDERTGTIVVGGLVSVGKAAVSHGNLTVVIEPKLQVSQPQPFSGGTTVVNRTAKITANQDQSHFFMLPEAASVEQIAETLNAVGTKPGDVIAIFEGLRAAGALHGQLVVR